MRRSPEASSTPYLSRVAPSPPLARPAPGRRSQAAATASRRPATRQHPREPEKRRQLRGKLAASCLLSFLLSFSAPVLASCKALSQARWGVVRHPPPPPLLLMMTTISPPMDARGSIHSCVRPCWLRGDQYPPWACLLRENRHPLLRRRNRRCRRLRQLRRRCGSG